MTIFVAPASGPAEIHEVIPASDCTLLVHDSAGYQRSIQVGAAK